MNKGRRRKGGRDKSGSMPKITFIDDDDDSPITGRKKNDTDRQARITCGGLSTKINIDHIEKLKRLHKRIFSNILGADEPSSFSRLLITLLLRYEGAGFKLDCLDSSWTAVGDSTFSISFLPYRSSFNCYEYEGNAVGRRR